MKKSRNQTGARTGNVIRLSPLSSTPLLMGSPESYLNVGSPEDAAEIRSLLIPAQSDEKTAAKLLEFEQRAITQKLMPRRPSEGRLEERRRLGTTTQVGSMVRPVV